MSHWFTGAVWLCSRKMSAPRTDSLKRTYVSLFAKSYADDGQQLDAELLRDRLRELRVRPTGGEDESALTGAGDRVVHRCVLPSVGSERRR